MTSTLLYIGFIKYNRIKWCGLDSTHQPKLINRSPKEKIKGHEPANVMIIRRSSQKLSITLNKRRKPKWET